MESLYKKKGLNFTNKFLSLQSRHAETFKARESSRFKRLSMLRNIDNEESITEEVEIKEKPVSRLEMLRKWKLEKQLKKEMEIKNKPFYAAVNSSNKATLGATYQTSRILNYSKLNDTKSSDKNRMKAALIKKPVKVVESSAIPTGTKIARYNSKVPAIRNIPNSENKMKTNENFLKTKNQDSSLPKQTSLKQPCKPLLKNSPLPKPTLFKPPSKPISKNPLPKPTVFKPPIKPISKESFLPKSSIKPPSRPVTKESSLPKPTSLKPLSKPVSKIGIPASSSLPKRAIAPKSEGRFLQKTSTAVNHASKFTPTSKLQEKSVSKIMKNVAVRPKVNITEISSNKLSDRKPETSSSKVVKEIDKNKNEGISKDCSAEESLFDHDVESISEQRFNDKASFLLDCSISIIKPRPSFAPENFEFVPPASMYFPEDDELFQRIKNKFISRTSTPTKASPTLDTKDFNTSISSPPLNNTYKSTDKSLEPLEKITSDQLINQDDGLKKEIREKHLEKITSDQIINQDDELKKEISEKPLEKITSDLLINQVDEPKKEISEVSSNITKRVEFEINSTNQCSSWSSNNSEVTKDLNNTTEIELPKPGDICIDSPLYDVDPSKIKEIFAKQMELMQLDDEEFNDDSSTKKLDADNFEKKHLSLRPKRASMLKNITDLDEIAESSDCDLSSPAKTIEEEKLKLDRSPRRSIRLINLNSPAKDASSEKLDANKKLEKKPSSFRPQRVSLLKNITDLDQIAESVETSDCDMSLPAKTLNWKKNALNTPQWRQNSPAFATSEESPSSAEAFTPRRSIRLQNTPRKSVFRDSVFLPGNEEKLTPNKPKGTPRRSMRLIDLNTPENDNDSKSNVTIQFNKLSLNEPENMNPETFLTEIESPGKYKSKKVSLLYSPQKIRKSMRKSIRGDLMSFSPCD